MSTTWKLRLFTVTLITIGMYFNGAFAHEVEDWQGNDPHSEGCGKQDGCLPHKIQAHAQFYSDGRPSLPSRSTDSICGMNPHRSERGRPSPYDASSEELRIFYEEERARRNKIATARREWLNDCLEKVRAEDAAISEYDRKGN